MLYGLADKLVTINLCALHGNEEMTVLNSARIDVHATNVNVIGADNGEGIDVLEQFVQSHISYFLICSIPARKFSHAYFFIFN